MGTNKLNWKIAAACLGCSLTSISIAQADVKVATAFGDHMVLQRDMKLPIWGTADVGDEVTVTAGSDRATGKADDQGKWSVTLDPLKASDQPIDVSIAGKTTVKLHDVLVGDVWVCSGQSNMEFQLGGGSFGFGGAHNAAEEIPKADHPTLRLLIVKKKIAFDPQSNMTGDWMVSTPETAPKFSAVGYFFGTAVQADQHVPVGLIGTYWGGQPAQAFTSIDGLKSDPSLAAYVDRFQQMHDHLPELIEKYNTVDVPAYTKADAEWKTQHADEIAAFKKLSDDAHANHLPGPMRPQFVATEPKHPAQPDGTPSVPTVLFNGMISPIVPMAIKGAIWYQGEANAGDPVQYQTLFPTMITDWRKHWGEGDFPFFWVQLASFYPREAVPTQTSNGWPGLREAQAMTLKLPNTGQAVAIDIGQANDIHPKDKLDVGNRLALAARHVAYGEDIVYSGPTFDNLKVDGAKAIVTFKNIGSGLTIAAAPSTQMSVPQADPDSSLNGFSVAGDDKKFYWADAKIDGDHVIVSSDKVPTPVAVRYAWANNPEANLYNSEKIPASPFRTDTWVTSMGAR